MVYADLRKFLERLRGEKNPLLLASPGVPRFARDVRTGLPSMLSVKLYRGESTRVILGVIRSV